MASHYCDASDADSSDTDTSSAQRPESVRNAVTIDTWKGELDFDRACNGPEQRCWLCTELTPWNRAMHGLAFELAELRPGKLRLRSMPHGDGDFEKDLETAAAEASFLLSWLLQHHQCIDELRVGYGCHPGFGKTETPFPIRLRPSTGSDSLRTVRSLELQAYASTRSSSLGGVYHDCYKLEDLDAVRGLERLELEFTKITPNFDVELAQLLRRNAGSIKTFKLCHVEVPRHVNKALRYLFNCESLTLSSFHCWGDRIPGMNSVARLLHSSTALKELCIFQIASARQMSAIVEELEANTTLEKLAVHVAAAVCCPEPLFTVLGRNTTLRELEVTGCRISRMCGHSLASLLLSHYSGLRHLHLGDVEISGLSLLLLAVALSANTTLESLHLSDEMLPINGVAPLCKALSTNKTLKKLRFTGFKWPQSSRDALARQLSEDDLYGRVQLPWTQPDLPGLLAAQCSSLEGMKELHLPDICSLSLTGLEQLFDALASNTCVRTLKVRVKEDPGEKGRALCDMLRANRTIECLDIMINKDTYKFVEEVCRALAENVGITKMLLGIDEIHEFETATALSHLLAHNTTATKFFFGSMTSLYPEFVEEFSQGMLQNKTIVKFGLARNLLCDEASFRFFEAVRKNQGALNRAVDFVVSPSIDRQCAEGFERFSGRPCLLKELKKGAGKTESEALLGIAAAERYLHANFLLITGIVQHSIQCHPAEGTQVDALNSDCWLAIARHLKVADVVA
ncbi:uncharacterized protein LOC144162571 [Haemaphysalis longicornis]